MKERAALGHRMSQRTRTCSVQNIFIDFAAVRKPSYRDAVGCLHRQQTAYRKQCEQQWLDVW